MQLTTAQRLTFAIIGTNANLGRDYKAPHAYRPTQPRLKRRMTTTLAPRLFKGHRP